ncbi:zinc ribbon domain-containing protein [Thermogemmatispora onikobensis]|uniref:zinc ribbon domain-containing protein n=1 Tax=Thermogemmatispora onikobensis TaxID=732234 RepID=UPI0008530AB1|nr:zinc ribbon domain-containing protein [Thermogemmatispora onikobensis]
MSSIWDSLHRGLEKASKEAARMGRIRYLRSTIERLKRDFSQQESGLVARTRELYEMGQLHQSELMPFCEALASLQQQLSEVQKELQSLQSGSETTTRGQTDIITSYPVPEPGTLPAWTPPGSGGERESTASSHPLYSPEIGEEPAAQIAPPPPPPPGSMPFPPPLSSTAYPTISTPPVGSSPIYPTVPASPLAPVHQDKGGVTGPGEMAATPGQATALPLSGSLCPSCKASMPPGVRFCTRCGQALVMVAKPGPSSEPEPGLTQQPTIAIPPPVAPPATAIDPASINNQETVLQPPPGQPVQGGSPDAPTSASDPHEGRP